MTDTAASSDDITALQLHTQCASGPKQQPHTATAPTPKHPAICICQSHSANTQYAGIADTTNPHHPPPNPPIRRGWLQSDLHTVLKKEKRSLILSPVHSIQAPAMFPAACECLLSAALGHFQDHGTSSSCLAWPGLDQCFMRGWGKLPLFLSFAFPSLTLPLFIPTPIILHLLFPANFSIALSVPLSHSLMLHPFFPSLPSSFFP